MLSTLALNSTLSRPPYSTLMTRSSELRNAAVLSSSSSGFASLPVGKLLFGSVGQNVVLHADCAVLVVKVPE